MQIVSLISRYWPFANGSGRIIDKYARSVNLGEGRRVAETSDGFSLQVYANDLIGRHILLSGKFDRSIVQVLLDHARPGDMLLDIGANIGYVSGVFLRQVRGSEVLCFEPQPGVVDLLRENLAQFGDRAVVVEAGLADCDGTLRFHVNVTNRGGSRISEDGEIEIPVREAGKALETIPKVDLVKIDVEGFEEPIFRALEHQLARLKPRAILFEDQSGAASPQGSIGSILARIGYGIYGIDKRLLTTRSVPIRSQIDCRFNDYLALLR